MSAQIHILQAHKSTMRIAAYIVAGFAVSMAITGLRDHSERPVTDKASRAYELRVEIDDAMYVPATDMSGDDCLRALYSIRHVTGKDGQPIAVPHDAPAYCVSM